VDRVVRRFVQVTVRFHHKFGARRLLDFGAVGKPDLDAGALDIFLSGRACYRWGEATADHNEAETPEYIFLGWTRHQLEWKKSFVSKWSEAARIFISKSSARNHRLLLAWLRPA